MIHEANQVRPNTDGLKVGGHQASSASVVSILTAIYFRWLDGHDLVAIKPHASPVYHAIRYLLGDLDRRWLPELRAFGGLQSYPSRTKDPDPVDFSTGSVGLGAVAPLFAALADRYVRDHVAEAARTHPERRFVALVGDAELDEGNVWEAILDEALRDLPNATIIVDLNRQSLDRVVPGIRVRRLEGMFASAGWQVLESKYGRSLEARFAMPGGDVLRRRIDDMPNAEYQAIIRRPGPEGRSLLYDGALAADRDPLASLLADVSDDALKRLLANLGGHDLDALERVLREADRDRTRPSVVFAYTIKGWRLPIAADAMNHSALLRADQIAALAPSLGADADDPWAAFVDDSPEGRLCRKRGDRLRAERAAVQRSTAVVPIPAEVNVRIPVTTSTQEAFGDAMASLARTTVGERIVTASPDVAVSTNLGGWINRVGMYDRGVDADAPGGANAVPALQRPPGRHGRHVELGISEMNLFMWLGQAGLTSELLGEPLLPVGTVYDPFICRGLDSLIYGLYAGSRFVIAGTPSGVTLAPEGGAHQSTVTPSLGIELPHLRMYEPVFAREVGWCLLDGLAACVRPADGHSTYLRLTTRSIEQGLAAALLDRLGEAEWRRQVLAGGYRLIEAQREDPSLPAVAPRVTIAVAGSIVPEAVAATRFLIHEEVAADLVVITSAERLAAEFHRSRLEAVRDRRPIRDGHLTSLLPAESRGAPIVTAMDGASHALSFLGGAFGSPVVPLGVDRFGQSGRIADLYADAGIDADHLIEAALLAIEFGG
jgi:pyruvate dehydrogenase E1 component